MSAHCAPVGVNFFGHGKGNYLFWIVQEKSGKFNFSALIFRFNWGSMDLFIHPFVIHRMQEEHP